MFNKDIKQQVNDTNIDYKKHLEDNILTSNLQNKITQEQLEYMKNLKGDDLEAFMMKASQVGKLKDVINYLDEKEIKKISLQINDTNVSTIDWDSIIKNSENEISTGSPTTELPKTKKITSSSKNSYITVYLFLFVEKLRFLVTLHKKLGYNTRT